MALNSYIAIFFTIIFVGKFLVVDSKVLSAIFDADEIAYVNPFCEKQNVKIEANNSYEALEKDSNSFNLTIDFLCNAPFKFETFTWNSRIFLEDDRAYVHHTPSLPESAKDRFYPPPKLSL